MCAWFVKLVVKEIRNIVNHRHKKLRKLIDIVRIVHFPVSKLLKY